MTQRLVYGIHPVRQLLLARPDAVEVYLQSDLGEERRARLADVLSKAVARARSVPADELRGSRGRPSTRASRRWRSNRGRCRKAPPGTCWPASNKPLVLVLDGVQDPRNFGACLRTADAAGAHLVVVARHRNVDVTPVVSKVAAGAAEAQPIVQVSNLVRFLETLKDQGLWIVGTDDAAGGPSTTWT